MVQAFLAGMVFGLAIGGATIIVLYRDLQAAERDLRDVLRKQKVGASTVRTTHPGAPTAGRDPQRAG